MRAAFAWVVDRLVVVTTWPYDQIRRLTNRRRDDRHAVLEARPGATLDLTLDGQVIARVVLAQITRSMDGTSVEFTDYFQWAQDRRANDEETWI